MELYKRIRSRREELHMSQDELAKKLGYKSRSSINKIELGENDIPQSKIKAFAIALGVNEAWLMGFDVPMERDNYEDQNIITFDAKSDAAIKVLETGGYTVSFSDDPKDDIITIINSSHEPVSAMHEYELVNKYESLQKRGTLSATLLAEIDLELLEKQIKTRKEYARRFNILFFEGKILDSFSQLNDDNKRKSISYTENLLANQRLEDELIPNAAHERTDIEVTDEMRKHDDDIMSDDSEWE